MNATTILCILLLSLYGNSRRKYCCHACYIQTRFQGGESRD